MSQRESVDPDLAEAAIAVAKMALMKRDEHPLFDHDAYKRALTRFEQAELGYLLAAPASDESRP